LKKIPKFANLKYILIAGMGNVKQGNWPGILIYFSVMILLGAALIYAERKFIEPLYQLPQSGCTFALLLYIAFTFFWNGTNLLTSEDQHLSFNENSKNSSGDKSIPKKNNLQNRNGINTQERKA
jgi:hypothetical protein